MLTLRGSIDTTTACLPYTCEICSIEVSPASCPPLASNACPQFRVHRVQVMAFFRVRFTNSQQQGFIGDEDEQ